MAAGVAGVCLVGALNATALGAPQRMAVLARGVSAFASDGSRYVAWQVSGSRSLTVLDTDTGRREAYSLPEGCNLSGEDAPYTFERLHAGGGGRFLVECSGEQQDTLDLRTGQVSKIPRETYSEWWAVGSLYAEDPNCDGHAGCESFAELATGRIFTRKGPGPFDLDLPGAPRVPICAPLRALWLAEDEHIVGEADFVYSHGVLVTQGRREGSVEIRRCKQRSIALRGAGEPRDFEVAGENVTWDTGFPSGGSIKEELSEAPTLLDAYDLETGRLRTWSLPAVELAAIKQLGTLGFSTSNPHAVFWVADETVRPPQYTGLGVETSTVYTAPL
jgi:hypothetical protein